MQRHFNVTTYIYNPEDQKFLFILHKKLNKWLAPGGHINENENPETAALRETKEETGLDVQLIGQRLPEQSDLIRPYGIQLNIISPNEHEHLDLIYLAHPNNHQKTILNQKESNDIRWFSINEINDQNFNTFDKNKKWCNYFFELAKN